MSANGKNFNLTEYIQNEVFIIAEIGKNFIQTEENQSTEIYLENAKALIAAAKEAGADAVKFQTHDYSDEQLDVEVVAPHFSGSDRYAWVKRNTEATPIEFWKELKKYSDSLGIVFFSTPMSRGAAQKLAPLDLPLWKVGSGDILDFVLLDYLASTKKPIIISSGMSTSEEVDKTISFLKKRDAHIILLHCVSEYPVKDISTFNLATIPYFREKYQIPIGFSDHSLESDPVLAAIGLGAKVIEKHFSFSRELWGSDHKVSLTPEEFKEMVERIRNHEIKDGNIMRGSIGKLLQDGEAKFRPFFRKSLVAGRDIAAGELLTEEMIFAMRPQSHGEGFPSERYEEILGKKVMRDIKKFQALNEKSVDISR